ncbi:sulfite exporter TauE/SafE family protein [Celeribacter ethanolicus]|uniref:sulfite exporter TauE/SafE family protein n=1 Tax=Celeribacter ethanolicus TaxID=1758178 RepID=UPI00082F1744|nr:sulfite exporter TauE/SafE family protein [Celeribacter ethanolicus]
MTDLTLYLQLGAVLIATGFVAGIIAGLLGLGGGIVLVPAFYFLFSAMGYESAHLMQVCVATSLATIVVTSLRSVQSHRKRDTVDMDILRTWAPGIVLGAVIGTLVATRLSSHVLLAIFGMLGMLVSAQMAFGGPKEATEDHRLPGEPLRSALSSGIGFLSVLMGIGGGSFGVPVLTLSGLSMHRAVGTAAGFGLLIALPSTISFALHGWELTDKPPFSLGLINLPAFAATIAMTLISTPLGVALAHKLPAKKLKRLFAVFLFLTAARMLMKAFGS